VQHSPHCTNQRLLDCLFRGSFAHQIGDDYLQKQAQGYAVPDSFTHGSSAQRMRWFKQGLQTGDWKQCDTFRATAL
jgi:predicted metalloprotease